ncbi:unnamed protein product [Polarella glacialis]|uniref:beta-ketoacyl-[acyl-carrier-protein] synthase I n=1 Tax=Polarella glacialis TaxID=89957 RepID=A0A813GIF3_POLGL|nr:unnamed protein product [Polarella glacialis]
MSASVALWSAQVGVAAAGAASVGIATAFVSELSKAPHSAFVSLEPCPRSSATKALRHAVPVLRSLRFKDGGARCTRSLSGAAAVAGAGSLCATALLASTVTRRGRRGRKLRGRTSVAAGPDRAHHRVVVTGLGVVNAHGTDKEVFYENLCAGKSAVKIITKFDPEGLSTRIAAQMDELQTDGYIDTKNARRMDDVVKYTIVSGKKALEDAGLGLDSAAFKALDRERCGILIGSAMGGTSLQTSMDNMEKLFQGKKLSPFFVPYTLVNVPGGLLAIDLGFQGPNYAVVTACATGNYCISAAAGHIEKGECDLVLAGGAEAAVTKAGIAGFIACKALSSRNDEPEAASRPWDKDRDGFVMGEGAGVLCLESLEHAQKRGATIYAEYLGGAFTCDAHHMTEPQPQGDGVSRCIKMAMQNAGVTPEQVGYVNCHGTSTPAGDMAEVNAIKRAFDGKTAGLVVNSTKSMIGHCLGAAAGLEAVVTVQALRHKKVHPTLNADIKNREEAMDIHAPSEALEMLGLDVAASNSFGFGGHNSCVVFRRWNE